MGLPRDETAFFGRQDEILEIERRFAAGARLVTIVGLFELTGALGLALGGDPTWRPFYLEGYLFIAAVYWVLCFSLSRYSAWLERHLASAR